MLKKAVANKKDDNATQIEKLTAEIDGLNDNIEKLNESVKEKAKERFYLQNAPYKDGDSVVALISNKEVSGILEYTDLGTCFRLRPYKKDGGISNTYKNIYHWDKILRYLVQEETNNGKKTSTN
jgi:hypothetical protein